MRRLILIIGIAWATLNMSAQTINTFGDLRAKVLHVGQKLTGHNSTNDQAIAVIVRELATNLGTPSRVCVSKSQQTLGKRC